MRSSSAEKSTLDVSSSGGGKVFGRGGGGGRGSSSSSLLMTILGLMNGMGLARGCLTCDSFGVLNFNLASSIASNFLIAFCLASDRPENLFIKSKQQSNIESCNFKKENKNFEENS